MSNRPLGCLVGIIVIVIAIVTCIVVVFKAPQICDFFVTHVFEWIERIGG